MKNQRWSLISAVSILIAVPVLASADPVTFHYVIEVTQRCQVLMGSQGRARH